VKQLDIYTEDFEAAEIQKTAAEASRFKNETSASESEAWPGKSAKPQACETRIKWRGTTSSSLKNPEVLVNRSWDGSSDMDAWSC
jgi:hypothetical protein